MSDNTILTQALESANYRMTLNLQRSNAKLALEAKLIYAENGGIFKISQELISFVHTLISLDRSSAVLIDSNSSPIEIENLESFLENILDIYFEASNQYHLTFKELSKKRNVASLVGN